MNDSTVDYYNNNAQKLVQRYESADMDIVHSLLLNTYTRGAKILEIGCGSGRDASFMLSKNYDVHGIDASPEMIQSALTVHPELSGRLHVGTIPDDLADVTETYDGIYAIACLMHLKEQELLPTFIAFRKLLKKDGSLLFSVPVSRPDLQESGTDETGRYFVLKKPAEWQYLLRESGFSDIETSENEDGLNRSGVRWVSFVGR
jgi:cyclopropane fatty-acyl-phospholipid synthase-like methyltransferase